LPFGAIFMMEESFFGPPGLLPTLPFAGALELSFIFLMFATVILLVDGW
jgi:hypothetical protein